MPQSSKATRAAKILTVDDSEARSDSVSQVLARAGFSVLRAKNGTITLQLARKLPDLVLLDINLPDVNAFEVCKRLKAEARTAGIPVIFISATYDVAEATAAASRLGALSCLSSPVQATDLLTVVNLVLRKEERNRSKASAAKQSA